MERPLWIARDGEGAHGTYCKLFLGERPLWYEDTVEWTNRGGREDTCEYLDLIRDRFSRFLGFPQIDFRQCARIEQIEGVWKIVELIEKKPTGQFGRPAQKGG